MPTQHLRPSINDTYQRLNLKNIEKSLLGLGENPERRCMSSRYPVRKALFSRCAQPPRMNPYG